jgi:predicted RNase H-like nuclease (RuvC/YqgF family)
MSQDKTKYRKKPVVIEAILWNGTNLREIIDFTGLHHSAEKWTWKEYCDVVDREGLKIFTIEGSLNASIGDYIIKGVKGEVYPCKPDIFDMTYEPADTPADYEGCREWSNKLMGKLYDAEGLVKVIREKDKQIASLQKTISSLMERQEKKTYGSMEIVGELEEQISSLQNQLTEAQDELNAYKDPKVIKKALYGGEDD